MNKHYELFRRNFPFIVREENEALNIINNEKNKFIDMTNDEGNLIASSIINENAILMLCVDSQYRKKGIGTKLLNASEEYICNQGYEYAVMGEGFNYLMPGIPMATKPFHEDLSQDAIYPNITNEAFEFFSKRGYIHSWEDANCFDMRANLENISFQSESIGDDIDGIKYRFANVNDIPKIIECTDDAEKKFSQYYQNEELYKKNDQKVLIATTNDEVCGTLIICIETEAKGVGSVGCTAVSHKYRGKHIGTNMVSLGTKYLKSLGLKSGFLGYTYSGLDKMYGYSGYKICIYYSMAKKDLVLNKVKLM